MLTSPTALAMLAVPSIVFPKKLTPAVKCKRGCVRNKHGGHQRDQRGHCIKVIRILKVMKTRQHHLVSKSKMPRPSKQRVGAIRIKSLDQVLLAGRVGRRTQ